METQIIVESADGIQGEAGENRVFETALAGGMLQPGEDTGGYHIEGKLSASGGEAEIYLCKKNGESFVLKYYYSKKPNLEVLEKVRAFSHQNINSILDYGEYKGRFFTILEYACGGALDDKLPGGEYRYLPLNDDGALQVVRETINAFEACHKAGIIHRDIKPGNLLYRSAETLPCGKLEGSGIMVGDFGISSIFEADMGMSKHLTETGARTEGYAAPEVYSGVIGLELDYYSLGVTLWTLLTGMEPFVNEKGHALYSSQIALDTIQGKTAENLLARSPGMSAFMQRLIRGLLTVRHEKRWKHDEVTRHLAGENVEVFNEVRVLPLVEIGGDSCSSYQEIAQAIVKYPEEGKRFVFKGKLLNYLIKIDQKLADRMMDLIDSYSAEKREDEGAVFAAYSLCPNMVFPLGHDISISDLDEILNVLDTVPEAVLPFLRDEKRGFYAYLEAAGLGEHGKLVKEIVNATSGDSRVVSRIIAAFQGNVIKPFQDGINNGYQLSSIGDLYSLPDYLKERVMIFIERNYGLVPAWIENITGINIDNWLHLLTVQKERIANWGEWEYFLLFMQGLESYDRIQRNGDFVLYEKNERKGLFCKGEMLYGIETDGNRLVILKTDSTVSFDGIYAVNLAEGYNENGVSILPFTDEEGRMAVFDGCNLLYFNIKTGGQEPRYELKDGEIELLRSLGSFVPIADIAQSLKERDNFAGLNKLICAFMPILVDEEKHEVERNLLLLIDKDNMEGLAFPFDFYLCRIGYLYSLDKSYSEALSYYEEALALNPSGVGASGHSYNFYCGQSFFLMNNWDKAIEYFDKAMGVIPEQLSPLFWKGRCLFENGSRNEAIACLTMALESKTGSLANEEKILALETRAECYDALGMKDKADSDRAEAAKL